MLINMDQDARVERGEVKPATYKWANAHEWLGYHLSTINDPEKLRQIVRAFAISHDSDDIQDLFEKEMDKDGYFTPLKGRRK